MMAKARLLACALLGASLSTGAAGDIVRPWVAGAYSFSDELGGFRIVGASGIGTREDPIVIAQEMYSASPVVMVIRVASAIRPLGQPGVDATGMIHLRLLSRNSSGLAWNEYEFELQEILDRPSVFGDGLSFDQRRVDPQNRTSSFFHIHDTDFEPYDRLVFSDGHVDPDQTADFQFFITDFTPKLEFYLKQDPRIPLS